MSSAEWEAVRQQLEALAGAVEDLREVVLATQGHVLATQGHVLAIRRTMPNGADKPPERYYVGQGKPVAAPATSARTEKEPTDDGKERPKRRSRPRPRG